MQLQLEALSSYLEDYHVIATIRLGSFVTTDDLHGTGVHIFHADRVSDKLGKSGTDVLQALARRGAAVPE
jgi:hypothetical protein